MIYFKRAIIFISGFLLVLLVLEAYLQLAEISMLPVGERDVILGNRLKSNHKYLYFNEGFAIGKINNYGYYGPSYSKERKENTQRITLVGDSFVEGVQVFERNHFRSKLERLLNNEKGVETEVLNFGRSGFNLNDDYCYFKNFVKQYNPSITLIFISPGDLVQKEASDSRPFAFMKNGNIDINYSFKKSKYFTKKMSSKAFRGKSIILGYIGRTIKIIKAGNHKSILFGKFYFNNELSLLTNSNIQKDSLSVLNKKIIIELNKEGCIFVTHTEVSVHCSDYLMDEFLEFSKENNINTIDMSSLFMQLKTQNINYNYWPITNKQGHFNERGHLEIAKYLKEHLSISKKIK